MAALKAILESGTKEDLEAKSKRPHGLSAEIRSRNVQTNSSPTEEKTHRRKKPADAKKAEEGEVVN